MAIPALALVASAALSGCTDSSSAREVNAAMAGLLLTPSHPDPVCANHPGPAVFSRSNQVGTYNFSADALRAKTPGGPAAVVAVSGQTFEGRAFSNPDGTCLLLDGVTDIVVRGNRFVNCKQAIELRARPGLPLKNIRIHDNLIEKVNAGIHVTGVMEEYTALSNARDISIHNNRIENIIAPATPTERHGGGIGFQFIRGCGLAATNNSIVNQDNLSAPSDLMNLFMSAGKDGDPIRFDYNLLRGGLIPSAYHTESSAGIVMGDGCLLTADPNGPTFCDPKPEIFAEHQQAVGNVLINSGKNGIGIAGGRFIRAEDNIMYGSRTKYHAFFGLSMYDTRNHNCVVYGPDDPGCVPYDPEQPTCRNLTVRNNRVEWWLNECTPGVSVNADGTCGALNDQWRMRPQYRIWPNNRNPQVITYCGDVKGVDYATSSSPDSTNIFMDTTINPNDYPF